MGEAVTNYCFHSVSAPFAPPPPAHPFSTFLSCIVTRGEVGGVGGGVVELILVGCPRTPTLSLCLSSAKKAPDGERLGHSLASPLTWPDTSPGSSIRDYNACQVAPRPGPSSHGALEASVLALPFKPRGWWIAAVFRAGLPQHSLSPASLLQIVPSQLSSASQLSVLSVNISCGALTERAPSVTSYACVCIIQWESTGLGIGGCEF